MDYVTPEYSRLMAHFIHSQYFYSKYPDVKNQFEIRELFIKSKQESDLPEKLQLELTEFKKEYNKYNK